MSVRSYVCDSSLQNASIYVAGLTYMRIRTFSNSFKFHTWNIFVKFSDLEWLCKNEIMLQSLLANGNLET